MKINLRPLLFSWLVSIATVLVPIVACAQPVLSGATMYGSTANGTWVNYAWNTVGGGPGTGSAYNLYFFTNSPVAPGWINGGNLSNSLNPNFQLSVGTNVIWFAGDILAPQPFIGFNFYFDNDFTDNLITAVTTNGISSAFSVVGNNIATFGDRSPSLPGIPGSGSIVFYADGFIVTLSDLHLVSFTNDLVSPYAIGLNKVMDTVGSFTLTVTQASTTVSGAIVNQTWTSNNSPYIVVGDINVAEPDNFAWCHGPVRKQLQFRGRRCAAGLGNAECPDNLHRTQVARNVFQ